MGFYNTLQNVQLWYDFHQRSKQVRVKIIKRFDTNSYYARLFGKSVVIRSSTKLDKGWQTLELTQDEEDYPVIMTKHRFFNSYETHEYLPQYWNTADWPLVTERRIEDLKYSLEIHRSMYSKLGCL